MSVTHNVDPLLERVKQAMGSDRWLDAEIECTFRNAGLPPGESCECENWDKYYPGYIKTPLGFVLAASYTSSIDAALGLLERVLPGTTWALSSTGERPLCRLFVPVGRSCASGWREADAATPPLAVLAALLTAVHGAVPAEEAAR